jgi:NADH-quinone oxidoreductase subunit M
MGMLSLLLWTPAVGGLLLAWIPARHTQHLRLAANLTALATLLLSGWLLGHYDIANPALQLNEYYAINPTLGSAYSLGLDGLSMPLLLLCTLLVSVAILASWPLSVHVKAYYLCLLALEFSMLGVLLAQDWVLFYIFLELGLIPVFFLINRWGNKRRQTASLSFIFYSLCGSVFMLISFFAVSQYHLEFNGSLITGLQHSAKAMPLQQQTWVLLGFLVGFAIKLPIFPLHGWLPLAHVEAPGPVTLILSGIQLKLAAYGLLRVLVTLPDAAHVLQPLLELLALTGILYGSLLAWRQSDLKIMAAYASISQMGLVLLAISNLNTAGINSAMLLMAAHGLTAGTLFLLTELFYRRTRSRQIIDYGGLIQQLPRWSGLMIIGLLASMNLPGTLGFIAQLQTMTALYQQSGWLWLFAALSLLITAAYTIRTLGLLFISDGNPHQQALPDLNRMEMLAAGLLVAAIVLLGLQPTPLINLYSGTAAHLDHLLNPSGL